MRCDGIFIGLKNSHRLKAGFYTSCCLETKPVILAKLGTIVFIIVWIFPERFNGPSLGMTRR